ncbi:MAG TPA: Holliday junction branch migration protein RuvA [Candidatus Woesebacteria bacterium]|nr:Holliday junction branch migration protein RuvA [Candidatus Woesebacteria bacterium]HNS94500.1 Holliday junction branch migration protein RuvA [Candidatus Woesebacteria bacterium]
MIGKIKGALVEVDGSEGLIATPGGVSYRVHIPQSMRRPDEVQMIDVYTYLHVREDQHVLYGFETKQHYTMFLMLLDVDGVGPKTAHTIVGKLSMQELMDAVRTKSVDILTQIPGLGKKTAQKIILELSSKLKTDLDVASLIEDPVNNEVLEALVALGYKASEARKLLKGVDVKSSTEDQIRFALQKKT